MIRILLIIGNIILGLMFTAGCSGGKSEEPGIVDYATGAEQIRTYKKTKKKIDDISKDLEARYKITD